MSTRITRAARRLGRLIAPAGALAAFAQLANAQVAVDQLELHVPLRSGATTATTMFHAANPGSLPAHATISMQDWDRSEAGENRYYPTGTLPTSCGSHVSVFPSVLQLEPRSAQAVRVMVDSAAAIGHGCYTILFVETPPLPRSSQTSGVQYSVRYGVKVYVEPEVPMSAEVTDVDVTDVPDTARGAKKGATVQQLAITYKNTGARQTVAHGAVEIRRPDNSVVSKVDIPEFPTLPGATRRLGVALPHLPAGRYVLLALLDYEGAEIAAGQVELVIP
jgi:P pilus assembly chaperone PapD